MVANKKPRRRQGGSPYRRQHTGSVMPQGPSPGIMDNFPSPRAPAKPVVSTYKPIARAPVAGPSSTQLRTNAATAYQGAQGANRDAIFRAAMQLGDPNVFAGLQKDPNFAGYQFAQDPNSVFASLGRQEKQGLEDIDVGANAGNTFFSGLRLDNRQDLSDEVGRQKLGATTSYLDDLRNFAAGLAGAEGEFNQGMADADQLDIDAALAMEPQYRPAPQKGSAPKPIGPKPKKKPRRKK